MRTSSRNANGTDATAVGGLPLDTRDDHQVAGIDVAFYGPKPPAVYRLAVPCDRAESEPQTMVSIEYTCTMPAIAPNGSWKARVEVYDGEFSGPHGACGCDVVELPFVVTGGTEDRFPPTLDSAVTSPDPVLVGSRFVLTIRSSDEHPATYTEPLQPQPNLFSPVFKSCTQLSETQLSPTQYEWTFDCPPYSAPGDYVGQVYLYDQMRAVKFSSTSRP